MLTELPEDVVVEVLCLLEVEDVLRVEQVCVAPCLFDMSASLH